jgi:uncharacterized protein
MTLDRQLTRDELEALAIGASFLGTGGGGDPYIGSLMARQALETHGPVTVIDPEDLPDDALCVMSAVMGAPTVLVEKLPGGNEQGTALHALEQRLGRAVTHIISAEVGGLNSVMPIVAAAMTGLPLVDCDAMGRAFPEIQMSTPTLHGIQATPMAIADDKGNSVVLDAIDNHWTERIARSVTIDMGAAAFIALFPQTGEEVKRAMIPGTLALAEGIGAAILNARAGKSDPVEAAITATGGFRLFDGKIVDVERRTVEGFARGEVAIDGIGDRTGSRLLIQFQNENLIATADGSVIATVPDLITVIEADTGRPITTEELRYGHRVAVVGVPCDPQWRTDGGLELGGPRYFGYDLDYRPVEVLSKEQS